VKQTFVSLNKNVFSDPVSTFGVMQVVATPNYVYSCGSDGRLVRAEFERNDLSFNKNLF